MLELKNVKWIQKEKQYEEVTLKKPKEKMKAITATYWLGKNGEKNSLHT